ncbi:MAG: sodium-independent anion transporter [Alphaproteobacteria bacterium]|nr:MAG: sodium-independent anion transporter [Alphaproteobacteria bacterium]
MNLKFLNLRQDLFGGLTSAIVALPLALAFGVASGLGPTAGLYGAIILGFVAAALGGTPVQISGPTGPMTVVVAGLVLKYGGSPEIIFMIIILCGIIQALFGVFRLGAYVNYVPLPVISGFMTGIGCIILLMEILPVLGDYSAHNGLTGAIEAIPHAVVNFDAASLLLGLSTFALTLFLPKKINQYIPSSLLALIIGTLIAVFYFPELRTIGEIATGMPQIAVSSISFHDLPEIITSAFMLALLGSIDTLLTSTVADKITKENHDSNKELIGQGIGNSLVGLFGGIPGAGATMRTMVNINAGGKSRLSGMLHALILLMLVTLMGDVAERIPQCVLAGLLLKVGIDIIDWEFIGKIKIYPTDKVFLMVAVLLLTIFSDLVTAIGLGLILSHMIYSKKMHKSQLDQIQYFKTDDEDVIQVEDKNNNNITIKLSGHLNYSITKDLTSQLNEALSKHAIVHLNFEDIQSVDLSVATALEGILKTLPNRNVLHIKIQKGETQRMFQLLGLFKHINAKNIHII